MSGAAPGERGRWVPVSKIHPINVKSQRKTYKGYREREAKPENKVVTDGMRMVVMAGKVAIKAMQENFLLVW